MKKENFTVERIVKFTCDAGKSQSIFWDAKTPGLGVRVTPAGAKSYIFESRLHGKNAVLYGARHNIQLIINKVKACSR